jgi:hypothetical protein
MGGIFGGPKGPSSAQKKLQQDQIEREARMRADLRKKEQKELGIEASIDRSRRASINKPQTLSGSLLGQPPSTLGGA